MTFGRQSVNLQARRGGAVDSGTGILSKGNPKNLHHPTDKVNLSRGWNITLSSRGINIGASYYLPIRVRVTPRDNVYGARTKHPITREGGPC